LSVLDNLDRHDIPGSGEKLLDSRLLGLGREVGHVNFPVHVTSFEVSVLLKHFMQMGFLPSGGGIQD